MKRNILPFLYVIADLSGTVCAWYIISGSKFFHLSLDSEEIFKLALLAASSVILSFLSGFYTSGIRRSRISEFFRSILLAVLLAVLYSFTGDLTGLSFSGDNVNAIVTDYFPAFFLFTWVPRLILSSYVAQMVHTGKWGTLTAIIGSGEKASDILKKIRAEKISSGNIICGYISTGGEDKMSSLNIEHLGSTDDIGHIIESNSVEEVIIATEGNGNDYVASLASKLEYMNVSIKLIPSLRDYITGRVELSSIYGTPLIGIPISPVPLGQYLIKSISDRIIALVLLLLLSPVIVVIAILIKTGDKGPVFFIQKRTGLKGKPFNLIKFRSMPVDAEKDGPMLSGSSDTRVNGVGKFLRRHRLDEIPNLFNVIAGQMSLVGPRPEREYFIEQIVKSAPHYRRLQRIKPGITSWGQVKYGYASSVEQMIERMEYDLLYLDNMSFLVDLRILFYTFLIIIKGKGV